ncbi:MAG: redox-sensing transcriptional repressor Rex, partial [Planctomycetes bacterium]|nr:redox-sensing transcriptional repressor Rex [Planctomycetota bacterium]
TQVRKDLAAIGVRGYPRIGYRAVDASSRIREVLGFDVRKKGIIVGAGRLGGALASYPGFGAYGLEIVAIFDTDDSKVGSSIGQHPVVTLDKLEQVISDEHVGLAVLAVPAVAAPALAERVVAAGVRAIWNFAPTRFAVPEGVRIRHEQISVGLAELSYHLK